MATKFYFCPTCGNVVVKVIDSGVIPVCCGEEMKELISGTSDGAYEKHLPVIELQDDGNLKVKVGLEPHPMTEKHYIGFIYLETEHGGQLRMLELPQEAVTTFCTCEDPPVAVYAYCNLHGMWKTEVSENLVKKKKCCLPRFCKPCR